MEREHFQHDVDVVVVDFQLWTLPGVDDVFLDEGMQPKMFTKSLNDLYVVDAVNVDPRRSGGVALLKCGLDRYVGRLVHMLLRVIQHGQCDGGGLLVSRKHNRPWRKAHPPPMACRGSQG